MHSGHQIFWAASTIASCPACDLWNRASCRIFGIAIRLSTTIVHYSWALPERFQKPSLSLLIRARFIKRRLGFSSVSSENTSASRICWKRLSQPTQTEFSWDAGVMTPQRLCTLGRRLPSLIPNRTTYKSKQLSRKKLYSWKMSAKQKLGSVQSWNSGMACDFGNM